MFIKWNIAQQGTRIDLAFKVNLSTKDSIIYCIYIFFIYFQMNNEANIVLNAKRDIVKPLR